MPRGSGFWGGRRDAAGLMYLGGVLPQGAVGRVRLVERGTSHVATSVELQKWRRVANNNNGVWQTIITTNIRVGTDTWDMTVQLPLSPDTWDLTIQLPLPPTPPPVSPPKERAPIEVIEFTSITALPGAGSVP